MLEAIFWLSLGLIIYTYVGYPVVLYLLGMVRPRPVKRGNVAPMVSVIIAAYNEEAGIAAKLRNTLDLRYPADRLEVIVVSDGSTDGTEAVVSGFESDGVRSIALPHRVGKSEALNEGVGLARGDVLVFTDVGAMAMEDCLEKMMSNFADPRVGCVSSEDLITGSGASEGAYVKYEMLLRKLESRVDSCVAVSGSFCAVRERLCPHFGSYAATDLLAALEAVRLGYRTVSDPLALARMGAVRSQGDEFRRKVRTVLTGLSCLPQIRPLLNPFKYGFFSLELLSHKLLRWYGGLLLLLLLVSNILLISDSPTYAIFLIVQLVGYGLALGGASSEQLSDKYLLVRLPYFFVSTNISAFVACWKYAAGQRVAAWQPSKRQTEDVPV